MLDISKWDQDDDPITREQVDMLEEILGGRVSEEALEGFLIVSSRFVDEFGGHRTDELTRIFKTNSEAGRKALSRSLEHVCRWNGGIKGYETRYPVTIIPPRPAFPLFKILGIEALVSHVYRVLDSQETARPTSEPVRDYIARTGRLPAVPRQRRPVRRSKPQFHWCSYETWENPEATRNALQISPEWNSDCRLRAALPTVSLKHSVYVAFNGDRRDPENSKRRFYKYFYEPSAQDHPGLTGGGTQVGVEGSPIVAVLEEWDESSERWISLWRQRE